MFVVTFFFLVLCHFLFIAFFVYGIFESIPAVAFGSMCLLAVVESIEPRPNLGHGQRSERSRKQPRQNLGKLERKSENLSKTIENPTEKPTKNKSNTRCETTGLARRLSADT